MTTTDESPEAIVLRIAPYAQTFHECLREAIRRGRNVFAPRGGVNPPFEPWLFANTVRWEVKQLLQESLPPGTPVSVEEPTIMSSVVIRLGDLEIRVRKSNAEEVPPPGKSKRMLGWYAQTLDGSVAHNILLLWHVSDALEYTGLDIAFPDGGTSYAPLVRWVVPLAEQATRADDLDIALPAAGEETVRSAGDATP